MKETVPGLLLKTNWENAGIFKRTTLQEIRGFKGTHYFLELLVILLATNAYEGPS